MAQAFHLDFEVKTKQGAIDLRPRIDAGFNRAGFNFGVGLSRSHYPQQRPGARYQRTYLTADKAVHGWRIAISGKVMEFGSTYYLPYLLFPSRKGRPPLWPNKRAELVKLMIAGFKSGVKEYRDE